MKPEQRDYEIARVLERELPNDIGSVVIANIMSGIQHALTEPEDEPLLHGELDGYVSPDCGCKYCEYGRNQIAQRKWDGFLEDTDYRELPDDMDIVDNLYRNWLQQENKTNGNH